MSVPNERGAGICTQFTSSLHVPVIPGMAAADSLLLIPE